jgi:DNA-binding NarL/FixJ family response regulator
MMTRILLADDHAVVRDGLRALFEGNPDISVVGHAGDGRDAIEAAQRLQPDAVVMDIAMPELDGVEATRRIVEDCPDTQVLILSMYQGTEHVRRAFQAGARGYILKESAGKEVIDAIRTVRDGRRYLSYRITEAVLKDYVGGRHDDPLAALTGEERDVMHLLLEGRTTDHIARALMISPVATTAHVNSILEKLEVEDTVELVQFGLRHGLVS